MKLTWQAPARQNDLDALNVSVSEAVAISNVAPLFPREVDASSFVAPSGALQQGLPGSLSSSEHARNRSMTQQSYLRELLPSVFATAQVANVFYSGGAFASTGALRLAGSPASALVLSFVVSYIYDSNVVDPVFASGSALGFKEQGALNSTSIIDSTSEFFEDFSSGIVSTSPTVLPGLSNRSPVADAPSNAVNTPVELFSAVAEVAQALEESYVTLVEQVKEYVGIAESNLETLAGDSAAAFMPIFEAIYALPEGPRTPLLRLNEYGFAAGGDENSADFGFLSELSLYGSLSRRGDPSEVSPDSNDLPGQFEIGLLGLDVGSNFQNGVYAGAYREETSENEGHRLFQSGMVDQSGTYVNDNRLDGTNLIALNPEAEGKTGAFDLIGSDVSIESVGSFLSRAFEADRKRNEIEEDSDAVDREMALGDYEEVSLFDTAGLELDPHFVGDFFASTGEDSGDNAEHTSFASPISATQAREDELSSLFAQAL